MPAGEPFIPLEFANAAYRYGHCQIRHRYQVNLASAPVPLFPDLLGFRSIPQQCTVDWKLFFDSPGAAPAQRCKKIHGKLVQALICLPMAITGECEIEDYHSLAVRDLRRGQGSDYPLARPWLATWASPLLHRSRLESPLPAGWMRLLCGTTFFGRADACNGGNRLGPVGGRVVTEVLVSLIDADETSYRHSHEEWRPRKTLIDLLAS